jgi:hypothetical protein
MEAKFVVEILFYPVPAEERADSNPQVTPHTRHS